MTTRVLIAGGGVAALEAALALRELAADLVDVELIGPEPRFWYRPVAVAEPFGLGETRHFDLAELAAAAGARYTAARLVGVDAQKKVARPSTGSSIEYDALVLACGAVPFEAVPGALTFRGAADRGRMKHLLEEISSGRVERVVFAVPWGAVWALPIYELALLTAAHATGVGRDNVTLTLVTPEESPLQLFGSTASEAVRKLLDERGIGLRTRACALEFAAGEVRLLFEDGIAADRVVALPRLRGPRIDGIPQTADGFVPVHDHCSVPGLADVFAAGDITTFPVKQGGLAAQQADAAAQAIAAAAGADLTPQPFRPVLRGLLLTGRQPQYLRHELTGGTGETSAVTSEPLWWPPAKIVGTYLAPFLAERMGVIAEQPPPEGAVPLEVELEPAAAAPSLPVLDHELDELEEEDFVGAVMTGAFLVVAPEDTLGEAAEKMRDEDVGSTLVTDYGRIIGILTSRDLMRAFAGRAHPSEARVREWMTAEPVTVSRGTTLARALALMTEHGFHHLPVVDGDEPVGLVGMRQTAARVASRPRVGLGF
jgi:sulfide:quinone oxidoreductase